MRPQETDINKEKLAVFDETDASFLSENKEFYGELINLSLEETVFDGEQRES